MHIHAGCPLDCKIGTMRQFEIREVASDALIIIFDGNKVEAASEARWWTDEAGVPCYAKEVVW